MVTTSGAKQQDKFMNNRPVVVGLGTIQQKGNFNQLDEALILMDKAFKKAIIDCTNINIKEYIDEVRVPKGFWRYRDPGKWVAENNNIKSVETEDDSLGIKIAKAKKLLLENNLDFSLPKSMKTDDKINQVNRLLNEMLGIDEMDVCMNTRKEELQLAKRKDQRQKVELQD